MTRLTAIVRTAWPVAAGVAAGLAAWKGRQLARQAAESATGSWADMLVAAQLEIGEAVERLLAVREEHPRRRRQLTERLAQRVDRYVFQAEAAAYPALKRQDPAAGDELFAGLIEIRCAVDALRLEPVDSAVWKGRVRGLAELVERQAVAESEVLVPALHQLPAEDYARLTRLTAQAAVRLV